MMQQPACDFGPCATEPFIEMLHAFIMLAGVCFGLFSGIQAIGTAVEGRRRDAVVEGLWCTLGILLATHKLWASEDVFVAGVGITFLLVWFILIVLSCRFIFRSAFALFTRHFLAPRKEML